MAWTGQEGQCSSYLLRLGESRQVLVNHQDVKNGAAQKSWKLPMYHHGGYSVWSWIFIFYLYHHNQFSWWRRWRVLKRFTLIFNLNNKHWYFPLYVMFLKAGFFHCNLVFFWRADLGLCQISHWQPWVVVLGRFPNHLLMLTPVTPRCIDWVTLTRVTPSSSMDLKKLCWRKTCLRWFILSLGYLMPCYAIMMTTKVSLQLFWMTYFIYTYNKMN